MIEAALSVGASCKSSPSWHLVTILFVLAMQQGAKHIMTYYRMLSLSHRGKGRFLQSVFDSTAKESHTHSATEEARRGPLGATWYPRLQEGDCADTHVSINLPVCFARMPVNITVVDTATNTTPTPLPIYSCTFVDLI